MNVNSVNSSSYAYSASSSSKSSQSNAAAQSTAAKNAANDTGVVYEKSAAANKAVDKNKVADMLKADSEQRVNQFKSMVQDMMKQQGVQNGHADSMWRFLAGGNFTVTAEAKAQAQQAISEDGYWGVNQTSDRIVEFAKALSGGDSEKADKLFAAFEKGFKEATKSWGKELPQISQDTYSAVKEKFDAWKNGTE